MECSFYHHFHEYLRRDHSTITPLNLTKLIDAKGRQISTVTYNESTKLMIPVN